MRQQAALLREQKTLSGKPSVQLQVAGKTLLNFASNDYLGLVANSEHLPLAELLARYAAGSGASHLISGHSQIHDDLTRAICGWLRRDDGLLFSSGYMANIGLLQALGQKGDVILADKLNHASLIDGGRLSDAEMQRYPHVNMRVLEKRLQRSGQNSIVVSDGVFSMDGDLAPLLELSELCKKYGALLVIDDAHGVGVLGENGGGICEHFTLEQAQVPLLVMTLGKAVGGAGAVVTGPQLVIDYLRQTTRSYIYTTAMSPLQAALNLKQVETAQHGQHLRQKLRENIDYLRRRAEELGLALMPSITAIQPLLIGDNATTLQVAEALWQAGFWVGAVRPPTVPPGTSRLRITLSAAHQTEHIEALLQALKGALQDVRTVQS